MKTAIPRPNSSTNCHKILHGQKHGYNRVACQIWAIKPLLMSNYEFTKIYLFLAKWAKKWKKKHYSWSIRAPKWKLYTVNYTSVITLHANFELNSSHRIRNIGLHSLAARIKWLKITVFLTIWPQNTSFGWSPISKLSVLIWLDLSPKTRQDIWNIDG